MSLWDSIRNFFVKPLPPTPTVLRNKPGGRAWIRGIEELNGRVVITVSSYGRGFWVIDPPQTYVATQHHYGLDGNHVAPGEHVMTVGISDDCLEPIRDIGDGEKDESTAWLPPVPQPKREYDPADHASMYPGY